MRTGIYVFSSTTITLTITAAEQVVLTPMNPKAASTTLTFEKAGTQTTDLSPGIYKAITEAEITVTGSNIRVDKVPDDKDPFPDAPVEFDVDPAELQAFFRVLPLGAKSAAF